jgi:hypothetical protein
LMPADAPPQPLGLHAQSKVAQASPAALIAREGSEIQLAFLRAVAQQEGLLLIAEWLLRTEHHLVCAPQLACMSDTPSSSTLPDACLPKARARRMHRERLALAGTQRRLQEKLPLRRTIRGEP